MLKPRLSALSRRQLVATINRSRLTLLTLAVIGLIAFGSHLLRSRAQIGSPPVKVTVVSAATFEEAPVAPESIAVAFGDRLAAGTATATSTPLPTTLAGAAVFIEDGAGGRHVAQLFFASPQQINFLIPRATAPGTATVFVHRGSDEVGRGAMQIAPVAPGLISANSNGQGPALGFLMRVPQAGQPSFEPLAEFDQARRRFVTRPLDLFRVTQQAERLFFVLFGTGIRGRSESDAVTARFGGVDLPASYAGAQGAFAGTDQVNIPIDTTAIRPLAGRGRLNLALTIAGHGTSNPVEIEVAGSRLVIPGDLKINSFEPARALAGETVTIRGEGFNPVASRNLARVGGLRAAVIEASPTQLKIKVPHGAESGRIIVDNLSEIAVSNESLTIRTSISGIVEDTRRRPIPGVTVRLRGDSSPVPLAEARTNVEGVFVLPLPDIFAQEPSFIVEVDGATAGASPHFPRVLLRTSVQPNRDNVITKPVSLQLATGATISVNSQDLAGPALVNLAASAASYDEDWGRAVESIEPQIENMASEAAAHPSCLSDPGSITLDLPPDARVIIPCPPLADCPRTLYLTQVENSRAPAKLPPGHFGSTMVQISPLEAIFLARGTLTIPNNDCLPANTKARLFLFDQSAAGVNISAPGRVIEIGAATVSSDGQRVTSDGGAISSGGGILKGGIYFVSVARPTATIIGRIIEPDNLDPYDTLSPAPRVSVVARGQEALTDNNGFFVLRNVPVLGASDRVAVEITYLRPEGRVERSLLASVAISAGATASIGDLILSAPNANRPPVVIAAPSFTAEEGRLADLNFIAADPDAGQTMQVRVAGPRFASLVHRGGAAYSLRVAPGFEDAGDYTLTITATDSQNAIVTQAVALAVFNVNQPPVANAQTVVGDEDTPTKITLTGSDPDRNALSYAIVARPAHGQLTGNAPDLTYIPNANYFGADSFTFKVNDGVVDSAPATVTITVRPVNDAPLLIVPAEQRVTAGSALNFAVSATDVDAGDSLTFAATDLPQGATFNQATPGSAQFSWTPAQPQTGFYIVTFRVADNGAPPLTATRAVAISVVAPNAGPRAGIWAATGGPGGGDAIALLVNGSNLFAGTSTNGVFRSTDGGETWARASNGLPDGSSVTVFTLAGDAIIAGSSYGFGIHRSTNNGDNWIRSDTGLPPEAFSVNVLVVKESLVFAGTGAGVYVSNDAGNTWRASSSGLPRSAIVQSLAVSGSTLLAAVDVFGSPSSIYRSTDNGQNWTNVSDNLPPNFSIYSFAVAGATLFAGTWGDGAYRSTDGGRNWAPVSASREKRFVGALLVIGDNLFVGDDRGVHILPVSGQAPALPRPALESFTSALAASGSGATIYAGTRREGVFRSTNSGQSWTVINNGYDNSTIKAFASTNAETFAATAHGVFVAANQLPPSQLVMAWQPLNRGLPESVFVNDLVIMGANLFASGVSGLYRLNLEASDQSRVWEHVTGLPAFGAIRSIATSDGALFAGVSGAATAPVFRSTDLGRTWTPASNGLPNEAPVALAVFGGKVFAAISGGISVPTSSAGVFVSTDNGANWIAANNGLPAATAPLSFATSGSGIFVGTYGKGVFISTNQGESWTPVNTNLRPNAVVGTLLASGPNLFAIIPSFSPEGGIAAFYPRYRGDVFISVNNGRNWAPVMSGLETESATALGASGAHVLAGTTGQGVFARQF